MNFGSMIWMAFLVLMGVFAGAFVTFDDLIKWEYKQYRRQWEQDGMPRGFFWAPPRRANDTPRRGPRYGNSANGLFFGWLFRTPDWMRADATALALLQRMRILVALGNLMVLAAFIAPRLVPR